MSRDKIILQESVRLSIANANLQYQLVEILVYISKTKLEKLSGLNLIVISMNIDKVTDLQNRPECRRVQLSIASVYLQSQPAKILVYISKQMLCKVMIKVNFIVNIINSTITIITNPIIIIDITTTVIIRTTISITTTIITSFECLFSN